MTLFLHILGTAALVYTGSFAACVVWIVLSGRRDQRRAREAKAAAVKEQFASPALTVGGEPTEQVNFLLHLPTPIGESEVYRWN